jgi:ABC-2 type transport system permease protein
MIRIIALREFRSLLSLPSTWFVLAALQFIFAWFFLTRLDGFLEIQPQLAQIANAPGVTASVAAPLFNVVALLNMVLIPMFTMRLIAEERRNQTLTLLLSSPVSNGQIVLGKFCGLMLFLLLLLVTTPLMIYTLQLGTPLDQGLLWSNVLGIILLSACYAAIGLYVSSMTAQPIIAAIGALAIFLGLWLGDISNSSADSPWHQLSPFFHFQNFNSGLLDTGDAGFFLIVSILFLLLTIKRLNNNRVYG